MANGRDELAERFVVKGDFLFELIEFVRELLVAGNPLPELDESPDHEQADFYGPVRNLVSASRNG